MFSEAHWDYEWLNMLSSNSQINKLFAENLISGLLG